MKARAIIIVGILIALAIVLSGRYQLEVGDDYNLYRIDTLTGNSWVYFVSSKDKDIRFWGNIYEVDVAAAIEDSLEK